MKHSHQRRSTILRSAAVAGALSLLVASPVGLAQVQPEPAAQSATQPATSPATRPNGQAAGRITREDGGFLLNFQDVGIDVVLNELSEVAGFIVVKEVRPEGRVTLVSKQPVNPEEAVSLLNTVLRNAGYAAIKQERILKIVAKDAAKRLNIPVRTGSDPRQIAMTDELITQVIPLRFADATQLKSDLQPLLNPEADFASNASSNALVITDTSANVRRVVEIVAALDTSVADSVDVKVFQLKFANAANAARLINDVFGNLDAARTSGDQAAQQQQQRGGGRDGGGGGDPREQFRRFFQQQAQQQAGQSRGQGSKVSAGSDDRTNSLVVTGPPDTLLIVAEVVKELDANPAIDETVFVYRLRNSQAANVEGVLNSLFNGTAPPTRSIQSNSDVLRGSRTGNNSGSNARTSRGGTSGFGTSGGFGGQTGRGGTGGFGAFGGFGQFQQQQQGGGQRISQTAANLASSLAGQVSIIADTDTNSLIIRTSPSNYEQVKQILEEMDRAVAQVLIKVLIAEVTHDKGYDIGVEMSALNVRATDALGNPTAGQSGGTSFNIPTVGANATGLVVQILEENFTATIRALETAGKLDVLSRPYILASDNQLASITVGQEVPFITNSRVTDTGQTINTIEYSDVGILLDVIPHINPDGLVILDVAPEISTLTGTTVPISELVSAPVIAKRSAQSRVGVKNGQTIVIGGLMEDRVVNTISKVPFLGDIPLLGEAFKRRQNTKSKTELLIFLTPHVATNPDMLPKMSKEEVDGTGLVPEAVGEGIYIRHKEGLERGSGKFTPPSTQPEEPAKEGP